MKKDRGIVQQARMHLLKDPHESNFKKLTNYIKHELRYKNRKNFIHKLCLQTRTKNN